MIFTSLVDTVMATGLRELRPEKPDKYPIAANGLMLPVELVAPPVRPALCCDVVLRHASQFR
jgi:hypothetical protein